MTNLNIHPASDAAVRTQDANARHTQRLTQRILIAILLLFILGVSLRFIINAKNSAALATSTSAALQRTVMITHAKPGALTQILALPTTLRGNNETSLYARSNGYLVAAYKNIGDVVTQGELLATIEAPEQDQELAQLQATQAQIQARVDLAQITATRYEALRLKDGISQHELEEKRSELLQARADLAATTANVKRLEQLRALRRIVAPFSGVIVRRDTNIGDLITAGGKELFALAQTDPLRLTIWVPQSNASSINVGQEVKIDLNGFNRETIVATVERFAGGIDRQTRSRQVDLLLRNPSGKLLPGAYAEAKIELSSDSNALIAPSSVLMTTADGFQVAVVDRNNQIAFRDIKIGRDLGREIEVLDGIDRDDVLIVSPSDLLVDGETVSTLPWEPKKTEKTKTADSKRGNHAVERDGNNDRAAIVTKS